MLGLSGSAALDTAIGLAFLFALLALVASGINELIARWLNLRSRDLERALKQLLTEDANRQPPSGDAAPLTVSTVLGHPLVRVLGDPGKSSKYGKMPSYIPSRVFASSVLDLLAPATAVDSLVARLPNGGLKDSVSALARDVGMERDALRAGIETWFDATMDRASGWYKRRAQTILFVIGFVLALAMNADAINVATTLWHNPGQRAVIVSAAETAASKQQDADTVDSATLDGVAKKLQEIEALQFPLGWNNSRDDPRNFPDDGKGLFLKVLGLLITGFAISLGAPFWFDVIGRGVSLRSSGKKPPPESQSPVSQ